MFLVELVELVLWYVVALLCVKCLNQEDDSEYDWVNSPMWEKAFVLTIAPLVFLYLRGKEAFKK